jgi:hypothetical protein
MKSPHLRPDNASESLANNSAARGLAKRTSAPPENTTIPTGEASIIIFSEDSEDTVLLL